MRKILWDFAFGKYAFFQILIMLLGSCELREWSKGATIVKKAIGIVKVVRQVTVRYLYVCIIIDHLQIIIL